MENKDRDQYLEIIIKKYPKVDLHWLEYIVASYLLYDVENLQQEKPEGENEDYLYCITNTMNRYEFKGRPDLRYSALKDTEFETLLDQRYFAFKNTSCSEIPSQTIPVMNYLYF